ncbi:hypothetical protein [Schleiferilactobacillus perolens]|uniref:Amidase domain-containing protein n=1 Tax=Schleiferilactobacillus perolens DSM 12744 TaxID=1423792 RepID=A0A0R1N2G6_9LACO|nr:hypothetical protein [Schleiferilactobacillus perolens]KRL14400.1 hypothetical protein FD09_GL000047 [Schleiferilactobacillus perolens DSM 12744]
MIKKMLRFMLLVASLTLFCQPVRVNAATGETYDSQVKSLYQQGISAGKINAGTYSLETFYYNYNQALSLFMHQFSDISSNHSFNDWFAQSINYGAMPDGSNVLPNTPKINPNIELRSQTDNGNALERAIQKGDILIVEGGGFGHAAIATSDNYILEMSGGGDIVNWTLTGIPNNNHQFSKHKWIFGTGKAGEQGAYSPEHIASWIQLWRPRNGTGEKAANYADSTFWNSNHGYTKNRYIDYRITSGTLTTNPNYCSKMVWQSFWYGTGSANVIGSWSVGVTFIAPGAIINTFESNYAPYLVGKY